MSLQCIEYLSASISFPYLRSNVISLKIGNHVIKNKQQYTNSSETRNWKRMCQARGKLLTKEKETAIYHLTKKYSENSFSLMRSNFIFNNVVCCSQEIRVQDAPKLENSFYLHFIPTGKTVIAGYYVNHILQKGFKTSLQRNVDARKLNLDGTESLCLHFPGRQCSGVHTYLSYYKNDSA